MNGSTRPEVKKVITRANALGIPLEQHIEKIVNTYVSGGVQGFKFKPRKYKMLQESIAKAIKKNCPIRRQLCRFYWRQPVGFGHRLTRPWHTF